MRTLLEPFPVSLNSFFHKVDGTGMTENPEATKIPIHNPYPNPPLHHPFIAKEKYSAFTEIKFWLQTHEIKGFYVKNEVSPKYNITRDKWRTGRVLFPP